MHQRSPSRLAEPHRPWPGPMVLDASSLWASTSRVREVVNARHLWLQREGWRHSVLAPGAQGAGCIDCGGVALPGFSGYRVALRRGGAESLIERARPDIVEALDPYRLAWAVRAATARLQVPAVAFCRSNLPLLAARVVGGSDGVGTARGRWAARRARTYLKRLYAGFELVLAPSRGMTERLRAWGIDGVKYQPLGVDCSTFNPAARNPAWRLSLCQHLGLAADTRLLVTSGHFGPEKNLGVLSAALASLGPKHALLAVGSGPCPPRGPQVHVLASAPNKPGQMARLLASADAYVHAGDQETFSLGTLEAMACGVPVVVSAAAGQGELVQDVGLTVQRKQAVDWAEAIRSAFDDDGAQGSQSLQWAQLALARAREHDWHLVTQRLSRHYRTLLGQQEMPARTPQAA